MLRQIATPRKLRRLTAAVAVLGLVLMAAPSQGAARGCLGRRATIVGTAGDDTLVGTRRPDVIVGLGGADLIDGLAGDDLICGGPGADFLNGAGGNDRIAGGRGNDGAYYGDVGGPVTANLTTGVAKGAGTDRLSGMENISGSEFPDILVGNDGSNILFGEGGSDTISAGGGLDLLTGDEHDDELDGGEGFDLAVYGFAPAGVTVDLAQGIATGEGTDSLAGLEVILGSEFNDVLQGDANANFLFGAGGDDTINGGDGYDYAGYWFAAAAVRVDLGAGTATGDGSDSLAAVEGMFGTVGFGDTLIGDAGPNYIDGDAGNDDLQGGGGDDLFLGGPGDDRIDGGDGGYDLVDFFADAIIDADLARGTSSGEGADVLVAIESLRGIGGNDILAGDERTNYLFGWTGDDTLVGRGGDDFLDGGDGNDVADGGDGSDNCFAVEGVPVACEGALAPPVHPLLAFAEEIERLKRFARPSQ